MRRGTSAYIALFAYLAAVLLFPVLHQRHHAQYGEDHVHVGLGTVYLDRALGVTQEAVDHQHDDFDVVFASLDLVEVAEAGALSVDCSLAAYTLVECPTHSAEHARRFGDELVAREHHHPAPDPHHGDGALEHLAALLLGAQPHICAPPYTLETRFTVEYTVAFAPAALRITHDSRGPPVSL